MSRELIVELVKRLFADRAPRRLQELSQRGIGQLDRLQANPKCVDEERTGLRQRRAPSWSLPFDPTPTPPAILRRPRKVTVAILREEGSNGDREMAAAFHAAGFEPWDVVMSDLLEGRVDLRRFRGVAAVGGFSYGDVLARSPAFWDGAV